MDFFAILLLAILPQQSQPDWDVFPGQAIEHASGQTHQTGQKNPLAFALIRSHPGDIIQVHGRMPHLDLSVGNGAGKNQAVRTAPFDVTITGADDHSVLGSIGISSEGGGIGRVVFTDVTIDARGSQVGVLGYMDNYLGVLEFHNVRMLSDAKTKWGYRIHGQTEEIVFDGCSGMGGGQEHFIYINNPKQNAYILNNRAAKWKRTHTQVVTRWWSGNMLNPQAATGNLIIEGNSAYNCGQDGAYNYTVAGWPNGFVRMARNYGESEYATGLSVVYRDVKQHQTTKNYKPWIVEGPGFLNTEGFAVSRMIWKENIGIFPNGDRPVCAFNSVEKLNIKNGDRAFMFLHAPGTGFELKHNGLPNGEVTFFGRHSANTWNVQAAKPFVEDRQPVNPDTYPQG